MSTYTYHSPSLTQAFDLKKYTQVNYFDRGNDWCEVVCCCHWRSRYVSIVEGTGPKIEWYWRSENDCKDFCEKLGAAIKAYHDSKHAPVVQAIDCREASFDLAGASATSTTTKPNRVVPIAVPIKDDDGGDA